MSAYVVIECQFIANADILCEALERLELKYEKHDNPVSLMGWTGDTRTQQAEIVVRKASLNSKFTRMSNDLGFKWNQKDERYDIVCSDYDIAMQMDKRVKQAYAAVAVEKAMKRRNFRIESAFCGQRQMGDIITVGKKIV